MDSDILGGCIGVIVMIVMIALIMAFPTLWLWNWLMPEIFGLTTITFWQALGLNFLTGIFFRTTHANNNN